MTSNKIIKVLDITIEHKTDYVYTIYGSEIPLEVGMNLKLKLINGSECIFPIIDYDVIKNEFLYVVRTDGLKMFVGWY